MLTGLISVGMLLAGASLLSADSYCTSAHGSAEHGVNRVDTGSYAKGHCAHCHEQPVDTTIPHQCGNASVYEIFDATQDFCYNCHKGQGSAQVAFDRTNYNLSYWFGGDTVHHTTPNNIYDVFHPAAGSAHNLQDILAFVKVKWPETFQNETNPCNACHNPHLSQGGYPVVRPTDRNNVWGDGPGEHMSDYAAAHGGVYQSPFRYGSTTTYEPDGSAVSDGSNMPDYVTFCNDCHNPNDTIYSTSLVRNVRRLDWARMNRTNQPGDYHGSVTRCLTVEGASPWGSLREPYRTTNAQNFILSCLDCHESHGAINGEGTTIPYMLRKTVNGFYNYHKKPVPGAPNPWEHQFCVSCHNHTAHCGMDAGNCMTCHFHNAHQPCWGAAPCSLMGPGGYGQGHTF